MCTYAVVVVVADADDDDERKAHFKAGSLALLLCVSEVLGSDLY
jgi:hypothetical protein